jgi:hypothetical protein
MLGGSLSPQHGTSSGCGWRKLPPAMEVTENKFNKQPRRADKGWSCSSEFGHGTNNASL